MSDLNFYRDFEDRYRGSRELIINRLRAYLPFIRPIKEINSAPLAVDLGCGRGEWLELLSQEGFQALGVELDAGMLAFCRQLNLSVKNDDALNHLKNTPDETLGLITGFHIAEHLPFSTLQELIHEALRALIPGGLLILETPNPENIVVGTSNFYLDPTHNRPIPPLLLSFLIEHAGFSRNKIVRLQEIPGIITKSNISLLEVLEGSSADYAIVSQKNGPQTTMDALQSPFSDSYGVKLSDLTKKYDAEINNKIHDLMNENMNSHRTISGKIEDQAKLINQSIKRIEVQDELINQSNEKIKAQNEALNQSNEKLENQKQMLEQLIIKSHEKEIFLRRIFDQIEANTKHQNQQAITIKSNKEQIKKSNSKIIQQESEIKKLTQKASITQKNLNQANQKNQALQKECNDLRNSFSWKITAPLRAIAGLCIKYLRYLAEQIIKSPFLSSFVSKTLSFTPKLRDELIRHILPAQPIQQQAILDQKHESFDEFVKNRLQISPSQAMLQPKIRQHISGNNESINTIFIRHSKIEVNQLLIEHIQSGGSLKITPSPQEDDLNNLIKLATHIYLALLRRYPSHHDANIRANQILRKNDVDHIILSIKKSEEFRKSGQ